MSVASDPLPAHRRGTPLAVGMVIGAISSIQFGAAFAATLFGALGPGGTAFLRLAIAAVVLLAVWRPRLHGRPKAHLAVAAAFGLTLGAMNWSIYESFSRIPLGIAVTLEFVGPLGVAVAGSRRPLDFGWIGLAGAGVILLADASGAGGRLDALGIALALVAGACWAAYILLSARTGRLFAGGEGLALAMVVGAFVTLPAGVVQGGSALLRPGLLAAALVVALASSVIPYSLELEALRRLPAAVFGVLMSLEPAIAAAAGLVVLGQQLGARELLAMALVLVASVGATSGATRPAIVDP